MRKAVGFLVLGVVYSLKEPLVFSPEDSGTLQAPIVNGRRRQRAKTG